MTLHYNFDEIIDRRGTNSSKWLKFPADVLPMWVADSDFRCPEPIVKALTGLAQSGVYGYPYAEEGGFEQATASWCRRRLHFDVLPDQVECLPSVGTALAVAVQAFTKPGDKVLMQTPIYPPFRSIASTAGRLPSCSALVLSDGRWEVDWADFERRAKDSACRLFLLCNPHNPTGRCFTKEELERMADICARNGVVIFSDEVHMDFVYPPHQHASLPTVSAAARANCLVTMSPSKTFNTAGLRTASVVSFNRDLQTAYRRALDEFHLGANIFGLLAYQVAYNGQCDDYADEVRSYIQANIDYATDCLKRCVPEIRCCRPEATYLLWLDCTGLGFTTQEALDRFFIDEVKLGLNSGAAFGEEGKLHMRMNLACPRATVEEAMSRIDAAVTKLRERRSRQA